MIVGVIFSAVCFVGRDLVMKLALALYPSYKNTEFLDNSINMVGVIRISVVVAFYCWFMWYSRDRLNGRFSERAKRELCLYGHLNILAFAVCTFFSFLPVVTRIAYYFSVSQLFMIPLMISLIDDGALRRKIKLAVAGICIVFFMVFLLQAHRSGIKLLPYRSWLFTAERYNFK